MIASLHWTRIRRKNPMLINPNQPQEVSTAETASEVECDRRGRQIVRDLELFLSAELAHPSQRRQIPFRVASGNDHSTPMQIQGNNPW